MFPFLWKLPFVRFGLWGSALGVQDSGFGIAGVVVLVAVIIRAVASATKTHLCLQCGFED